MVENEKEDLEKGSVLKYFDQVFTEEELIRALERGKIGKSRRMEKGGREIRVKIKEINPVSVCDDHGSYV